MMSNIILSWEITQPTLVNDADTAAVKPLAAWKARKGFSVTVTQRSQIPGGSDTAHVQQYIDNAYHNWPIPPTFVLFAGGTSVFPCYIGSQADNPPTDLYFACVQGSDYLWFLRSLGRALPL